MLFGLSWLRDIASDDGARPDDGAVANVNGHERRVAPDEHAVADLRPVTLSRGKFPCRAKAPHEHYKKHSEVRRSSVACSLVIPTQ